MNESDKEEGELGPLERHILRCTEEKAARKERWERKVEREDERTRKLADVLLQRASSVRADVDNTLNKQDTYQEYRQLRDKMANTCARKLKKLESEENKQSFYRSKRVGIIVPGTQSRRMTTEEYQMWRESNKMKRQGYNSTVSRWNSSGAQVFDSRAFATQKAKNLNNTQIPAESSKRQMPASRRAAST